MIEEECSLLEQLNLRDTSDLGEEIKNDGFVGSLKRRAHRNVSLLVVIVLLCLSAAANIIQISDRHNVDSANPFGIALVSAIANPSD